jgi:hypothetical protein
MVARQACPQACFSKIVIRPPLHWICQPEGSQKRGGEEKEEEDGTIGGGTGTEGEGKNGTTSIQAENN